MFEVFLHLIKEHGLKAMFSLAIAISWVHYFKGWVNKNAEVIAIFFLCLGIMIVIERSYNKWRYHLKKIKNNIQINKSIKNKILNLNSENFKLLYHIYQQENHSIIKELVEENRFFHIFKILAHEELIEIFEIKKPSKASIYWTCNYSIKQNVIQIMDNMKHELDRKCDVIIKQEKDQRQMKVLQS